MVDRKSHESGPTDTRVTRSFVLICKVGGWAIRVSRRCATEVHHGGMTLGYGVIGSPTDSGSVSLGSSPGTPARETKSMKLHR